MTIHGERQHRMAIVVGNGCLEMRTYVRYLICNSKCNQTPIIRVYPAAILF